MSRLAISIPNRIEEMTTLACKVDAFCANANLPDALVADIQIVLDELINNTISYGYHDDAKHVISTTLETDRDGLTITIIDDAIAFNPFGVPPPDLQAGLAERQIGGVGIHFTKMLMDSYSYTRQHHQNIVTLKRHYKRKLSRGQGAVSKSMEISEFVQDGVTVIEPRGRIDSNTSRAFGEQLVDAIATAAGAVIVDLSQIAYVSSAGFRSLLIAAKKASTDQTKFALCGLNNEVRRLFEIGAFIDLFQIFSSRQDGISELK